MSVHLPAGHMNSWFMFKYFTLIASCVYLAKLEPILSHLTESAFLQVGDILL